MRFVSSERLVENVILDPLGFLQLGPEYPDDIPRKLLRRMLLTSIWQNYQRGHILLQEAARRLAELPFVKRYSGYWAADEIASCLLNRRRMREVPWMLQLLDMLREEFHLRLFCVCNASEEEMEGLRCQFPALFAKFDAVYTSGEQGMSKPSLRFFQVALDKAGIHADHTMYLDAHDHLDSIVAARCIGMRTLLVKPECINERPEMVAAVLIGQLQRHSVLNINPHRDSLTCLHKPQLQIAEGAHDVAILNHESTLHRLRSLRIVAPMSACMDCTLSKFEASDHGSATTAHDATSLQESAAMMVSAAALNHRSATLASARHFLLGTGAHDPKRLFHYPSHSSEGIRIFDNFAQFTMADLLDDSRFLPMQSPPTNGLICFISKSFKLNDKNDRMGFSTNELDKKFYALDACTYIDIPEDLDTTSIGLSVLHKFGRVDLSTIHKVLDKMLEYVSKDDGILQVYFDVERPRVDPVVAANAMFLFHLAKRGHEVEKTERFVHNVLLHNAYEDGSLYYNLGEAFLVCVARLVNRFKEHFTRTGMRSMLVARLQEDRNATSSKESAGNALALAMRMRACWLCGLEEEEEEAHIKEQEELVRLQKGNGGWDCHPFYRYGSNVQSWIGNEGLTTAYALVALQPTLPINSLQAF